MKTVAFITLGCKVNQYETNAMSQKLIEEGYKIVEHTQKADIYIINTCTVTNMSDRKSRQMIRRAKEINPEAIIIAVGCYVQVAKKEIEKIAIKYKNEIKVKYSITENKKYTTEECCQECPAINKFLYINNLGQISPCTWVVSNYPEYKSELTLKNSNFTEIIKSQPIQKYLKYIKENQIKGCPVNRRKQ